MQRKYLPRVNSLPSEEEKMIIDRVIRLLGNKLQLNYPTSHQDMPWIKGQGKIIDLSLIKQHPLIGLC